MLQDQQLAAYDAAHGRVAFAELEGWGWVRLAGRDRLDLLHRLSTNDLKKLPEGAGAPTVLTSPTGRVMAALTVYADASECYLRTMSGQAVGVVRYLNSMIFWQDQVEVGGLSERVTQFALYGPEAQTLLERLSERALEDVPPYGWREASLRGTPASLHRGGPLDPFAWSLVAPSSDRPNILAALEPLAPQLDDETADVLRIEAGLPLWGHELSEEVTPLETGLLSAISFNKGCYTGQEVIARQTNYDKVTRNLAGLEFGAEDTGFLENERTRGRTPALHVRGPGRGGFVGSIAYSPVMGKYIGLAVLPRELVRPGVEVEVVKGDNVIRAVVRDLPFVTIRKES